MLKIKQYIPFYLLLILFNILGSLNCLAQLENEGETAYKKTQDSLRQVLLSRKDNALLKSSVFQELYIRKQVQVKKNIAYVDIFLDLHEWDCGAPDSYMHRVSFQLSLAEITHLPKHLFIKEAIYENESSVNPNIIKLNLIRSDKEYVIYHAEKIHKTLIIFKNINKVETALYYFQHLHLKDILHKDAYQLIDEGQENEVAPWRSTILSYVYESFL